MGKLTVGNDLAGCRLDKFHIKVGDFYEANVDLCNFLNPVTKESFGIQWPSSGYVKSVSAIVEGDRILRNGDVIAELGPFVVDVDKLVDSGSTLSISGRDFSGREIKFRISVLSFRIIWMKEFISESFATATDFSAVKLPDGALENPIGLLELQLVNLSKEAVDGGNIFEYIAIQDSEGFIFKAASDYDFDDEVSSKLGLGKWKLYKTFIPKIKARGSMAFVVPESSEKFSLQVAEGFRVVEE